MKSNWFYDPMMRLGGCAAIATCDLCIYLNLYSGNKHLYPFNIDYLQKKDYIKFSEISEKISSSKNERYKYFTIIYRWF